MFNTTIITGATASGKTSYALDYAKNFEKSIIINADASAVYKDFYILTAQPQDKKNIEHLLFEICSIKEDFTVSKWLNLVSDILDCNNYKNHHKIIVGGTCMYIFLLINGLVQSPAISQESRIKANDMYNKLGHNNFLDLVYKKDPKTKFDKQRLINNYAMILETGKTFTEWQASPKKMFLKENYELIKINPPREEIYQNCNNRFQVMLNNGALEEVEMAIQKYGIDYNFKKILCANEIKDYITGVINKNRMLELCTQKTRNLAKSQITWLNNKL